MLNITSDAAEHIIAKGNSLYFEYLEISNCCIPFQSEPTIRFGKPYNPEKYKSEIIDGINIYIPHALPDVELSIKLHTFIGLKRLVVDGWRHA